MLYSNLAILYQQGTMALTKSDETSFRILFELAAKKGNANAQAQFELGNHVS